MSAATANPVAEAAIIAGLVNCGDPIAISSYALDHRLSVDDFTVTAFQKAYSAVLALAYDGSRVDVPILSQRLESGDLAAVQSACAEHVSAANFSAYARILKDCRQARQEQAARERLAKAVADGAPPHELAPLLEAIRASGQCAANAPPPFGGFSENELQTAKLHPKCIVEHYLYTDLALVAAAGGTGKTTMLLYEAACIALGRHLWGNRVVTPGKTLFITAEDSRELFAARLREIMAALELDDYDQRIVRESIGVWDVSGDMVRLAALDAGGNIVLTDLPDRVIETYRNAGLVQVVMDPCVSFGPGERLVNDAEQSIVTACRRIMRGLGCCVRLIHHSGKANARAGAIDQYAARGGTALPDGCRMVTILSSVNGDNGHSAANPPDGWDLVPGESGFILARAKLSYCPPQPNLWIRRRGYAFSYFVEQPRDAEAVLDRNAEKVASFLADELTHGRRYTARSLEAMAAGSLKMTRISLRSALASLEASGRLEERELPTDQRRGRKKTYLYCAATVGAMEPENSPNSPTADLIAPPDSIAPPYREERNGAIDAVPSSPDFLQCAKLNGAIAAQWRNRETGLTCPDTPATGEIGNNDDLPNGSNELAEKQDGPAVAAQPLAKAGDVEAEKNLSPPPEPLTKDAERVIRALMQADGNALRVDALLAKLAKPRMTRNDLATALAELQRLRRVARIDGAWHLLDKVMII